MYSRVLPHTFGIATANYTSEHTDYTLCRTPVRGRGRGGITGTGTVAVAHGSEVIEARAFDVHCVR